jgi:hypothetical protein
MSMNVVHVWDVSMRMTQWGMLVEMSMRLAGWIKRAVRMTMVLIVHVRVSVSHTPVHMLMLVMLDQMKPNAQAHEAAGDDKLRLMANTTRLTLAA